MNEKIEIKRTVVVTSYLELDSYPGMSLDEAIEVEQNLEPSELIELMTYADTVEVVGFDYKMPAKLKVVE